jgi:hypothetical protein
MVVRILNETKQSSKSNEDRLIHRNIPTIQLKASEQNGILEVSSILFALSTLCM